MSLLALSAALQTKITDPLAKFVLMLLANRHNADTGQCFPSLARICEDSAISRRTVINKLQKLEAEGYIKAVPRTRDNGSQTSNGYLMLYLNGISPEPSTETKATPKRIGTKSIPPIDWTPAPETVAKLRERYPHHETSEDTIEYLTREWLQYCHSVNAQYVQFDTAWAKSAERYLRHQSTGKTTFAGPGRQRNRAGALSGALARAKVLLRD